MHLGVAAERRGRSIVVLDIDRQASTTDVRRFMGGARDKADTGCASERPSASENALRIAAYPLPRPLGRTEAEITSLTWMADNLLRHTVYVGLRGEAGRPRAA